MKFDDDLDGPETHHARKISQHHTGEYRDRVVAQLVGRSLGGIPTLYIKHEDLSWTGEIRT